MVDFYGDLKERINALVSDGYVTYFEALECVGNGKKSETKDSVYDKMIVKMKDDSKKHCYNGAVFDFDSKKILYMCDSNDYSKRVVLLENDDQFIQIDNTVEDNVKLNYSKNLRKVTSLIYIDGVLSHLVVGYYNLKNELLYESISIAKKYVDLDLIENHNSDKLEVRYVEGKPAFARFNNDAIERERTNDYIEYTKESLDKVFGVFNNVSYNRSYVKK